MKVLFCFAVLGFSLLAADPAVLPALRVDTNLVLIPVSVTDARNHAIVGLGRDAFRIFEGKVEQPILHFAREDSPVSVGIVLDSSGSMREKLAASREAVARFLAEANVEDEFFLVNFDTTARIAVPFTRNPGALRENLLFTGTDGRTALLDAVCLAMNYLKHGRTSRKALLIVSDGGENNSRYTESEIRLRAQESGLWIYSIAVDGRGAVMLPEEEHGGALLESLTESTGGRHFRVRTPAELYSAAAEAAFDLHNHYVIGYRATSIGPGKYHRVQVKVTGRDLHATWRQGYFE